MAEDLHGDPGRNTLLKQQGRRGVAGVVATHRTDTGRTEQRLPRPVVSARVNRGAVHLRKHEVEVSPLRPCSESLLQLGPPMLAERRDNRIGKCNRPLSSRGFRRHEDETGAPLSLERLAHRQGSVIEVHVPPSQSQRFALT